MYGKMKDYLSAELKAIEEAGLYKKERVITSMQKADITVEGGKEVLNFCANNYLGLSNNPRLIEAAKKAMDERGYGMSSVRFICGTQDIHKQLEKAIADYFGTEDTILYAACFDANGGVFEPLLTDQDAIICRFDDPFSWGVCKYCRFPWKEAYDGRSRTCDVYGTGSGNARRDHGKTGSFFDRILDRRCLLRIQRLLILWK